MNIAQKFKDQLTTINKAFADTGTTLLATDVDFTLVRVDTVGGATTLILPAATAAMQGQIAIFVNLGANAANVQVVAGYGGVGAAHDLAVLARGDMAFFVCDGTYWYFVHNTAAV